MYAPLIFRCRRRHHVKLGNLKKKTKKNTAGGIKDASVGLR